MLAGCGGGAGTILAPAGNSPGAHPPKVRPALSLPQSWRAIGTANWISVDSNDNVYAVTQTSDGSGGDSIALYDGTSWSAFGPSDFGATQVSVAPDGTLMALTAQEKVYHYSGGSWNLMSGMTAREITATTLSRVFVVSTTSAGGGNYNLDWWNGHAWVAIGTGAGTHMSWEPTGQYLFAVNAAHVMYAWTGSAWALWKPGDGNTQTMAAGPNGTMWRVDPQGALWYWDTTAWTQVNTAGIGGTIVQVADGSQGVPFVRTSSGTVYEPGSGPNGSVYALNSSPVGGIDGSIVTYAPGVFAPPPASTISTLPNASWNTNGKMTFDAAGDLWVAYEADPAQQGGAEFFGIAEYAPGSGTPARTITPANSVSDGSFQGIAIDASGNVYVPDVAGAVYVYAAGASGSATPIRTISGSSTELTGAGKLGFDANGNLWVATGQGILEFPPNANGNVAPIGGTMDAAWDAACNGGGALAPMSFAFDPSGNMIVAANTSSGNVLEFAAGFTDTTCPYNRMTTQNGGGANAEDLSVDDQGYIYDVAYAPPNGLPFNVSVYPESASGSPSPYAEISGTNSGLSNPVGIAVWTNTGFLNGNAKRAAKRQKHAPMGVR